ncbi:8632_t:CDS:2, partial [Paraglomus occultum]
DIIDAQSRMEQSLHLYMNDIFPDSYHFIGNTNIAIGNRMSGCPPACWKHFDYIINCTPQEFGECSSRKNYLLLPIPEGKKGQHILYDMLPVAIDFLNEPLRERKKILIHCSQGVDRSVGIALGVIVTYYDDE